jgi:hypothetical protein
MPANTLLIPFALPPAEHAKDLLMSLRLPALATLLARASEQRVIHDDPFAPALPHEHWLAARHADNSPAVAHALMQAFGRNADASGHWFLLQPVHLHIARDHLVLTDPQVLQASATEAQALFDAIAPLVHEAGHELAFGDARHWFLRADGWAGLRTCTPGVASGHNIDIWSPRGPGERDWRRLHNEVQMLWHQHPVNEARDSMGLPRINALWLWGGSDASSAQLSSPAYVNYLLGLAADGPLAIDDRLASASLAGDWSAWLAAMQALDTDRFAPLLAALRSGAQQEATLLLSDAGRLAEWRVTRNGMRKFWRSPSLANLATLAG